MEKNTNNTIEALLQELKNAKSNVEKIKNILGNLKNLIKGMTIDGYIGDFPTFIEPVYITPGVKIGDTVLLGPNVYLGKGCVLGDFTELSNVILSENVITGKKCKLNFCVVDENVSLPEKFLAKDCLITKSDKGDLEIIKF